MSTTTNTFNSTIPYNLDIQWVKNDKLTFLNEKIVVWYNKKCGEGLNVEDYDGEITIKKNKNDLDSIATITTSSGEMIFTDNVITFDKVSLKLNVREYYYSLKLIDKIDTSIVGTLFEGKFKVIN